MRTRKHFGETPATTVYIKRIYENIVVAEAHFGQIRPTILGRVCRASQEEINKFIRGVQLTCVNSGYDLIIQDVQYSYQPS